MGMKGITPTIVKQRVDDIIYNRIGTSVGSGVPKLKEKEDKITWSIPLIADYPRIIRDQSTSIIKYKILHIGNVGEIILDENGEPIKIPSRFELDKKIEEELFSVQSRISRLLLENEASKYAKLVSIKHMANPLTNIITNILIKHNFELPNLDTNFGRKIVGYVDLLVRMKLISREGNIVSETLYLQKLYDSTNNDIDTTLELVLKDMIENEYQTFYSVNPLSPYIKIPSTYYDYALSAQDIITLSMDDLWEAYISTYPGNAARQQFRFPDWLRVLSNRNICILSKTSSGFQGHDEVLDVMTDDFQDSPILSGMVI